MIKSKNAKFLGVPCLKMEPTKQHRPAIWECMLGTVYALSPEGEVKYFDYDWEKAKEFAGVSPEKDPRMAKVKVCYNWIKKGSTYDNPRKNKTVLWILK